MRIMPLILTLILGAATFAQDPPAPPPPRLPDPGVTFRPAGPVQSLGADQPDALTVIVDGMSTLHSGSGASFDALTIAVKSIRTTGSAIMLEGPRIRRLLVTGEPGDWGEIVAGEYAFFGSIGNLEAATFRYLDVRDTPSTVPQSLMRLHAGGVRMVHVHDCRLEKGFGLESSGVKPVGRWYCSPLEALVYERISVHGATNLNLGGPPSPTSSSYHVDTVWLIDYEHHTDAAQFFGRGAGIPIHAENVRRIILDGAHVSNPAPAMINADRDVQILVASGGASYNGEPFDEARHVRRRDPHMPRVALQEPPGAPITEEVVIVDPPVEPVDPVEPPSPPPPPVEPPLEPVQVPVTIWCWDPWPAGVNPPPAFDVVARFKDRQVSSDLAADSVQVMPADLVDLIEQYTRAMKLPRGTRPIAATWQNHAGKKGRVPLVGSEDGNGYWCERTQAFVDAISDSNLPRPQAWLFDTETSELKSAPVYDACVWPQLRELSGDGYIGCDWKGGDNAYGVVLYADTWEENLERLREAIDAHPGKEIIPWIKAPGTRTPRGIATVDTFSATIAIGAAYGVRRWYLWGDWGLVSEGDALRDWIQIERGFFIAYKTELYESE
jgi:hypothetical protein